MPNLREQGLVLHTLIETSLSTNKNLLFIRCSQVNKSRVSVLKLRKIWFRRGNKRRKHGWFWVLRVFKLAEQMQQWLSGSLGTCVMLVSQALCLSLQIWRFGFSFCKADSWAFHHNNYMMEMTYGRWHHLLSRCNHNLKMRLSPIQNHLLREGFFDDRGRFVIPLQIW